MQNKRLFVYRFVCNAIFLPVQLTFCLPIPLTSIVVPSGQMNSVLSSARLQLEPSATVDCAFVCAAVFAELECRLYTCVGYN